MPAVRGQVTLGTAMPALDASKTSSTLLHAVALVPMDQAAWSRFVDRYRPKIANWARHWGLQDADVEDVTQAVLAELAGRLRRFQYDPARSFRGFLKKLVRDAHLDALSARRRTVGGGGESLQLTAGLEARDDLVGRLEAEFDLELLEEAQRRVRERVEPQTWNAFFLTAVQGRPAPEAASALGMRVGTVYQAKSSIIAMLRDEVRKLDSGS
jgi:RNA polymerase sigma factor (sigma-70 family)